MQHRVKSEIDVLIKGAWNVFELVIYIKNGKWPKDEFIIITLISLRHLRILDGSIFI